MKTDDINNYKYDDSKSGGYSFLEKLALVARNEMDPKEIGMASKEEAQFKILGKEPPKPFLGDWVTFEASVVPISVQAHWARQELKIVPTDPIAWEADWCAQHKNDIRLQGILRSGSCFAQVDRTYTDIVLGFADLLKNAAELLAVRYEQVKLENPEKPIKTRDDLASEAAMDRLEKTASTSSTPA